MNPGNDPTIASSQRWLNGLRFALLLLSLLLTLIFGSIAISLNQQAISGPLGETSSTRYALQQQNLHAQLSAQSRNAEYFAQALNALATSLWGQEATLRRFGQQLLEQLPADSPVVAAGVWPEPRAFRRDRVRSSLYWTLDDSDERTVRNHNDYNNPANISYHGESWYSPSRYQRNQGCYWTERYQDPFLKKAVIACTISVQRNNKFVGATSIVLDPSRLQTPVSSLSRTAPFYLLLDHDQHILSASGIALNSSDTLPMLAQHDKRFGNITVQLHNQSEQLLARARSNQTDWQVNVSDLSERSRQLSQLQAEKILARLSTDTAAGADNRNVVIQSGALNQTALTISSLGGFGVLLSGHHQAVSLVGWPIETWIGAALTAGTIALALLMSFLLSSGAVVAPLQRLLLQLRLPPEDTHVDTDPANEIGLLGELINARHNQIRKLQISAKRPSRKGILQPRAQTQSRVTHARDSGWAVIDALAEAVALTDGDGKVRFLNSAAEALSGWNLAQARGLDLDEVFHILGQSGKQRITRLAQRTLEQPAVSAGRSLAVLFKTRSGHRLPCTLSSAPIRDARGQTSGAVVILAEQRSTLSAAGRGASELRDRLTGLLNRQAFETELASRCQAARQGGDDNFALLFLDVDHMQDINQAFGSEGGDEFLRQLARLIQNDIGDANPVYRLHSDKFAVLLDSDDQTAAQLSAEMLCRDVQGWGFQWRGERRDVSMSASVTLIDKDSGRPGDILRQADAMCQQAQNQGRGQIVSGRARTDKEERRDDRAWLTNIKKGLAEDRFHLSTQQIRSLQRSADEGHVFSTLMSLEDEEGFWAPSETFMPVAERYDMAEQLDRWTIDQVFKQLTKDPAMTVGIDFCMIPLSLSSMQSPRFLDFMIEHFKDSAVSPGKICLDMSESMVNTRITRAHDFCRTMHRAGCRLSLSGVSTRPSSYKLIRELPVQYVRFEPALTHKADRDPVDRLATESLHRIVQTLGKQSIARDVNSPELLRVLQGIGINYAQGDAVARPSPIVFQAQA